jgi:hypothetical protein
MIIEALAVRSTPKPDDCRAYVLTDYLFSHRPEVPLHAVNSDREDVDEAHVLGVFASRGINTPETMLPRRNMSRRNLLLPHLGSVASHCADESEILPLSDR